MSKVYVGFRQIDQSSEKSDVTVLERDEVYSLEERLDLKEHSITGFSWGSAGNGAAQLALALLADATANDEYAKRHHHWFKLEVISLLPEKEWKLNIEEVLAWVNNHHPLHKHGNEDPTTAL